MRLSAGLLLVLGACAASPTRTPPSASPLPSAEASASGAPAAPKGSCAATYAEMNASPATCDLGEPRCEYPEGACTCTYCPGGAAPPPNFHPRGNWRCAPKECSGKIVEGGACTPGVHCGVCYGPTWDCKNGKWVGIVVSPPP